MPRYAKDLLHDEIELYYDGKPGENTVARLRENGWKWNLKKQCWRAKNTEENVKFATKECSKKFSSKFANKKPEPKTSKKTTKAQSLPLSQDLESQEQTLDNSQSEVATTLVSEQTQQPQNTTPKTTQEVAKTEVDLPASEQQDSKQQRLKDTTPKKQLQTKVTNQTQLPVAPKKAVEKPSFSVEENVVEFAQNTPNGVTVIKITKGQDNAYRISSKNGLIMCADCKKHISIRSPKCMYCGASLGKTLDVYFKLQHKKKDAEDQKQTIKDQKAFKKQNVDLFEERHEIFFSREHRKYLMDLKLPEFNVIIKRSEYICANKNALPYFSQDNWMRLMRLTDEGFEKEIEKLKKN